MRNHRAHGWMNDENLRRKSQYPEAILSDIGLKAGFTFMDIGCGRGFFTLPAARIAGDKGRVYGVDISSDAIAEIERKAAQEGLKNLTLNTGKAEDTIFCEACADIIFFGIVLHDFSDPARVLVNAHKMLKPDSKLVNLDWKKIPTDFGPPLHIRFTEEEASRLITAAGFEVESVKEAGPSHYLIIARPHMVFTGKKQ